MRHLIAVGRRRGREVLTGRLPETAVEPRSAEMRIMVLDARERTEDAAHSGLREKRDGWNG